MVVEAGEEFGEGGGAEGFGGVFAEGAIEGDKAVGVFKDAGAEWLLGAEDGWALALPGAEVAGAEGGGAGLALLGFAEAACAFIERTMKHGEHDHAIAGEAGGAGAGKSAEEPGIAIAWYVSAHEQRQAAGEARERGALSEDVATAGDFEFADGEGGAVAGVGQEACVIAPPFDGGGFGGGGP